MIDPSKVLKEHRITEKASELCANLNQYTFEVFQNVNKIQILQAVQKVFNVKVSSVNVMNKAGKKKRNRNMRGNPGRTPKMKKAIVSLVSGHSIEMS